MEDSKEIEAYTKLLMKCVSDEEYFDESLIKYLLNYKREIIEGYYFIKRETYGVIKSNLWGYIKSQKYNNEKKIEKWAKILNKEVNEKATYKYIKFNFYDREKRDRKAEYKPFYFKSYGKTDQYIEVSEEFLNITENNRYDIKIDASNLNENEIKLIMNDVINDSNVNGHGRLENKEGIEGLISKIKEHIVSNYEELEKIAKEDKKSILRVIAMGDNILNSAFQSIQGKERDEMINKYKLEEKYLMYMRYKDISKSFLVHSLYEYKDKEFWIKEFNCYSKKENIFSVREAIKDFIQIGSRIDEMYETKKHNISNWKQVKFITEVDSYWSNEKSNRILNIINFFKEELKNSKNYKEEMEKLMIVAIIDKSEKLYFTIKDFMSKENGDKEDMDFKHPIYKEVSKVNSDFIITMKKKEIEKLNKKLSEKLEPKGNKEKKLKI